MSLALLVTLLAFPLVIGGVMKIVGGIIAVVVAVPFIIGLIVGWVLKSVI